MEQILLSISMLASNRTDTIRRTLDSLKPIMEQLPSELILVDTSTDPEVLPILAEYTNHIIKFQWVNDFSAARNVGLEAAKGEWFLYIDDDEWFEDVNELIRFFKSGEYKEYGMANYIQRNFHDPEWLHYSDVWVSRMIKKDKDTRFRSKIHEYVSPVRGRCKNLKLIANHTGYIAVTEEDRLKKYNRNSILLKEMIEEEPERLRWRVQLAQEYWAVQKWEELLEFCLENIEYTQALRERDDCQNIGTFYGGAMESLVNLKRYQEAKRLGNKAIEDSRMTELCKAYIHLRLGVIAMNEKQWQEAKAQVNRYFKIREELFLQEEKYANQKGALIIDETFESVSDKKVYSILIACGLAEGNTKVLEKYFEKLEWNQKVIYVFEDFIPVLLETMATASYEPIFKDVMQCLWKNKELQNSLCIQISALEKIPEKFEKLYFILQKIKVNHWYICYVKNQKDNQMITTEDISLEKWEEQINDYVQMISLEELITRKKGIANKTQSVFIQVLEILLAKEIAYSKLQDSKEEVDDVKCAIKEYRNLAIKFIEKYYREEIKQNYSQLLPVYGQVAVELEKIAQNEDKNSVSVKKLVMAELERR